MRENKVWDTLLTVGAVIGGAFLVGAALEALGKRMVFYKCPNCQFDQLEFGMKSCPNCHTTLEWNGQNGSKEVTHEG